MKIAKDVTELIGASSLHWRRVSSRCREYAAGVFEQGNRRMRWQSSRQAGEHGAVLQC